MDTPVCRMDESGPAVGAVFGSHPGAGHHDGCRLGVRVPEFRRLLGLGPCGECLAGALAGAGGRRAYTPDLPPYRERAANDPFIFYPFLPARSLFHLPDTQRRPAGYIRACVYRRWHHAVAPARFSICFRDPRPGDLFASLPEHSFYREGRRGFIQGILDVYRVAGAVPFGAADYLHDVRAGVQ